MRPRLSAVHAAAAALLLACHPEPDAEALYGQYCGLCHGVQGEGYVAPQANALSNPEFLASASDVFLRESTVWGRPGTKMSPWGDAAGGPLTAEEVDAIVGWVRDWQTLATVEVDNYTAPGDPQAGAPVYAAECASCHGASGQGASALSLNHPEFLRVASDGYLHYALTAGRTGTPMAAYADRLTATELDDLVALIRSWETP